ncbi:gp53-like domain-containing protein [Serratia fonticola]
MAKNEFLPFSTAANANVLTNAEYQALAARSAGFQAGVAKSKEFNKAWRQGANMASALGQFIADKGGKDVLDDGNIASLTSQLGGALSLFTSLSGVIDKNGYVLIPVNIAGVIKNLLLQWGSGQINAHTGFVTFPTPYPTAPFIVIPAKVADNNRYINAVNYTKIGFELYGFIPSGDGNIDSYSYLSIGW